MSEVRPPFVKFETRTIEDRAATIEQGHFVGKDVDFIVVIPHGQEGKLVIEQPYGDWLAKMKPQAGMEWRAAGAGMDTPPMQATRFPRDWLDKIEEGYKAWKEGREIPLEGTALINWPVLPPSIREVALALHIRTVEEFASMTDDTAARIGMGAIALRQRAVDWLRMGSGEAAKVSAEKQALAAENKDLKDRVAKLEGQIKELLTASKAKVEA